MPWRRRVVSSGASAIFAKSRECLRDFAQVLRDQSQLVRSGRRGFRRYLSQRCTAHHSMKTTRKRFNGSWFIVAIVGAIIVGELVATVMASAYNLRANPLVVAFLSAGLVAAIASVFYEGADID